MVISSEDSFRTSDTALSAYLVSEGFGTPEIEFTNGMRAFFIFSRHNPKIDNFISDFDTARAIGNIVLFFNAYQTLLRRIRERY
jgi:hypothetical protein